MDEEVIGTKLVVCIQSYAMKKMLFGTKKSKEKQKKYRGRRVTIHELPALICRLIFFFFGDRDVLFCLFVRSNMKVNPSLFSRSSYIFSKTKKKLRYAFDLNGDSDVIFYAA